MRRLLLAAIGLSLVALPAGAMTVAEFLAKAKALQARGMMAAFSSDLTLLKDEMTAVGDAYRADLAAARAAGRAPHSCPPPRGQVRLPPAELIAELEKIPPSKRGMSMRTAFYGIMARRYPCR